MVQSRWEWGNSEANQTKSPQFRLEHRSWISNLLNHQIPFLLPFQIITYSSSVNYWIWVSFNFWNTSPIWVLSSVGIEKVSPPRPNLILIPFLIQIYFWNKFWTILSLICFQYMYAWSEIYVAEAKDTRSPFYGGADVLRSNVSGTFSNCLKELISTRLMSRRSYPSY